MQARVINPYTKAGNKHKDSLDYIIANLPPEPTFDDLNAKLVDSFFIPDPNNPSLLDLGVSVLKTILPNAYNGYVNGGASGKGQGASGYWRYNEKQMALINQLLDGINKIPVE